MAKPVTYRGQQFSVGRGEDAQHTQVLTKIDLPVQRLRSAEMREGLERRSESSAVVQFAMVIEIEYDGDPSLVNDCLEMFRHAANGLCHSALEYREAYARYQAVGDAISVAFHFSLEGWDLTLAVLCPGIQALKDELPENDTLNCTYLPFAMEGLTVLLGKIDPQAAK